MSWLFSARIDVRLESVVRFKADSVIATLLSKEVVRQGSKVDVHEPEVYADSRASSPINMPVSQSAAGDHPAIAGRHCRSGARQSMPSIRSTTALTSASASPPGLTFEGHKNTPCSNRFVNSQRPVPSQ